MDLFDVNWLAVVLAALTGFVVGGIWYGPVMGKSWMAAVGKTEADLKEVNPIRTYGLTFLLALLASWTLAHTFASYGKDLSVTVKIVTGFGVALGFILPALWTNYLFQDARKPLFWIDGVYWLLFYTAMGAVHAFMP